MVELIKIHYIKIKIIYKLFDQKQAKLFCQPT